MITRLLQTTFALLLLLSPALVNAHTNEANQAELKLLVDNNYQLSIDIDVLHVIKSHQKSSVDEADLINHLKNLSLIETKQLLSKIL